jgi:hypothetical protein
MHFKKIFFSTVMLATSIYIIVPTADEIIIHPTFGLFLSYTLNLPYVYGVLLSIIIYRALGLVCLAVAILVGGKPAYFLLREKMAKMRIMRKI